MGRAKPRVHGRDHEHGGADATLIHYEDVGTTGTGGGEDLVGIQFDVYPQTGDWLYVEATTSGDDAESFGIDLKATDGRIRLLSSEGVVINGGYGNNFTIEVGASITFYETAFPGFPILRITGGTGVPTYHIQTGASWIADL